MYVRTSASNALLSPARAWATRAPSRAAAATRSGDAEGAGSAGTLALTESVTLGRAEGSARRRAACGILDPSAAAAVAALIGRLELALRLLLGTLARLLLQLGDPLLLLGPQQRHDVVARLREPGRERVDHRGLGRAERGDLLALLGGQVVRAAGWTPRGLQRVELLEQRRRGRVEPPLDEDDLRPLAVGERQVTLVLDHRARHVHRRDRAGLPGERVVVASHDHLPHRDGRRQDEPQGGSEDDCPDRAGHAELSMSDGNGRAGDDGPSPTNALGPGKVLGPRSGTQRGEGNTPVGGGGSEC